jgi:hypothetical protein
MRGRGPIQFALTGAVVATSVVWIFGFVVLSAKRPPPSMAIPPVEGVLIRYETGGGGLWEEQIDIFADGRVQYLEQHDGAWGVRAEGHISSGDLERMVQSFAVGEFCHGQRVVRHIARPMGRSGIDPLLTYFGCSPARSLRSSQLPARGWWWAAPEPVPAIFETPGIRALLPERKSID